MSSAAPNRERRAEALHVFALAGLAAQPLYDLLARSPEFFLVRRATLGDVLLPPVLFSLVVPSLLVLIELVAAALGGALGRAVQRVVIGLLAATIVLPVFVRFVQPAGFVPLVGALAVGGAFAVAYQRLVSIRMFVGALAPAIVVLPAVFVVRTWPVAAPGAEARQQIAPVAPPTVRASVVMLVFDEFTLGALLDGRGDIDHARYPGFARLARDGMWFRNATSVATVTQVAVPALLTGRLPPSNALADPSVRAHNLFTLLAASHRLDVTETYVPFCPAHLCGDRHGQRRDRRALTADLGVLMLRSVLPIDLWSTLPDIDYASMLVQPAPAGRVGAFLQLLQAQQAHESEDLGRREQVFADFIERLGTSGAPALHYLHVMLPHEPSVYMPSGAICANDRHREPGRWPDVEWQVARAYQRYLLQVEFVDGMIRRLIEHLERTGTWDSTLLVVTADHGVSFRPGDLRRALTPTNECDILRVPLFIKAPGQRTGGTSDRNVESIDVLPTIASLLGVKVPWPIDGMSAVDPAAAPRSGKIVLGPSWPEEEALFAGRHERQLAADFGVRCGPSARAGLGVDERGTTLPFAIGPYREVLDRPVRDLPAGEVGFLRGTLDHAERYRDVDPGSGVLPCPIAGRIGGADDGRDVGPVAIALDGTIRAVTETESGEGGEATFSAVVPEAAFRPGLNRVTVYRIVGPEHPPRLQPVPGPP